MSTFNRRIPLLALALCGLFAAGQASAEIKIGVVNFEKLLEEAPQTKAAMQSLDNEFGPRRRELMTLQNDLKAKDEKLQKEGAVMSEADRANAEKTLRDQQREFQRKAGEFQDDASTRKNEEIGKVQRYLVQEIQTYANAQGYDLGARPGRVLRQTGARHHLQRAGRADQQTRGAPFGDLSGSGQDSGTGEAEIVR